MEWCFTSCLLLGLWKYPLLHFKQNILLVFLIESKYIRSILVLLNNYMVLLWRWQEAGRHKTFWIFGMLTSICFLISCSPERRLLTFGMWQLACHQESEGALVEYEDKAEQIDIKREINFMAKILICAKAFSSVAWDTMCLFTLSLISRRN